MPRTALAPIAEAYGLDGWSQIERLDFTFHGTWPDRQVQRRWSWEPHRDWVTLHGDARGGSVSYQRAGLRPDTPSEILQADQWFLHDSLSLLFPFYAVWSQWTAEDAGMACLPQGQDQARKIIVQGVTAGSEHARVTYELFIDEDRLIRQWRRLSTGHAAEAELLTWAQHARLGPIVVSLERRDAEGIVRVWFSDVRAMVAGSSVPRNPEPLTTP